MQKFTESQAKTNQQLTEMLIAADNDIELKQALIQAQNAFGNYCGYGVETKFITDEKDN